MRILRNAGTSVLAVLALAACEDTGTTPAAFDETTLTLDVATLAADAVVDEMLGMALGTAGMPTLEMMGGGPAGAPGGPGGHASMTRSHTVTFFDGGGNEMDAYDPLTTASIHIVSEMSGTRETPLWSGSIARFSDRTVSGLEGEETTHTWNGTGTHEQDRTRFDDVNGDRQYQMSGTSTTQNVVVGVPRAENPWPLSGTITHTMKVIVLNGPDGDREVERTAVVTFNGTQFATMTVGEETFEVDLADRQGRRPRNKGPRR